MEKKKEKTPKSIVIKGVTWSPEIIKEKIAKSDNAVKAALLRIYTFQTAEEQQAEQTVESNGKGFNGNDAKILSSFAEQLQKKGWLSPKQIALSRKKLAKYSRQLYLFIVEERQQTYRNYGLGD